MKKVSIMGVGLIGGSLGLALRKKAGALYSVTGVGRNIRKLRAARDIGAVDYYTTDYQEGVKDADIVVICLPVHLIPTAVKQIIPFLKPGAIVSDAGSVKGPVVKEINVLFHRKTGSINGEFIGAHPMAGSERSGVAAADEDLYSMASVVLTSGTNRKSKKGFNEIKKMWLKTGAKVIEMRVDAHDKAVAMISHLPHIMAFNLCLLAGKIPGASKVAAGSFRDLTRIAGSNPADWASICNSNKKEVSRAIDRFISELKAVKNELNDPRTLEKRFTRAKKARQHLYIKGSNK